MKCVHKEQLYIKQDKLSDQLFDYESVFFDIETTGFSPMHSTIYLIGCARRVEDKIFFDQFLAETKEDEAQIIQSFLNILKEYKNIISFNGIGFDIPFLKAKCNFYHYEETFEKFHYLDIFKSVSNIKFLLKLPNYKQKSIENFLGLSREDTYNGGELINVYQEYLKQPDTEKESLLLLHNYEDVIGMIDLLPILSYIELFHGQYAIKEIRFGTYHTANQIEAEEMIITLKNDYVHPKRVSYQFKDFYLICKEETTTLHIPVYRGNLKFFYSNYKDYYYLPEEDCAMHKSVASFVDKGYRENAHAYNCYVKKDSRYLPQYTCIMQPEFKKDYKDKITYFEITEDFCNSDIMLRRYIEHILQLMFQSKKGM